MNDLLRANCLRFLGLLGCSLASTWTSAAPLDLLRECAASTPAGVTGAKALESACPGLGGALTSLQLDGVLHKDWQANLNRDALADLTELAGHYAGLKGRAPDTTALRAVLDSLDGQEKPKIQSWWQSFEEWLRQWLAKSDSTAARWLKELLDRWLAHVDLPASLLNALAYLLTAVAAVAAILVIIRELRAAALGKRSRHIERRKDPPPSGAGSSGPIELDSGSAKFDLAELLRALVKQLVRTGRLKSERSLTHRELIARSLFEHETQRTAFTEVAQTAERLYYGPGGATPSGLSRVTQRGIALLEQLSESKDVL